MLGVPYVQKDAAKAFGARWDRSVRRWYVPAGVAPAPFARWLEHTPRAPPRPSPSPTASRRSTGAPRRSPPVSTPPGSPPPARSTGAGTRERPDGYWANTCPRVRPRYGSFYLVHEAIPELATRGVASPSTPASSRLPQATFEVEDEDRAWALEGSSEADYDDAELAPFARTPAPPPAPAKPPAEPPPPTPPSPRSTGDSGTRGGATRADSARRRNLNPRHALRWQAGQGGGRFAATQALHSTRPGSPPPSARWTIRPTSGVP